MLRSWCIGEPTPGGGQIPPDGVADDARLRLEPSTGQDGEYFGWADAKGDTVQRLAAKFLDRFPEIARLGRGRDWPYAGWYVEMLGLAERGVFPICYADWCGDPEPGRLPTTDADCKILPTPPGGEAEAGRS